MQCLYLQSLYKKRCHPGSSPGMPFLYLFLKKINRMSRVQQRIRFLHEYHLEVRMGEKRA